MFRDRPLTWLFVIATICVDLVMVVPMLRSPGMNNGDYPRMIFFLGVPAQLSLVAVWGAIGNAHRLTRGAVVTLVMFLLTISASLFPYSWSNYLTFFLAHTLLVVCGTLILRSLGWLRRWPSLVDRKNEKFRYSVIEMFGWTTIVAIWAFALSHATAQDDFYVLYIANFTTIPLITIALVCRSGRYRALLMLAICAIAVLSVWCTTGRLDRIGIFAFLCGNLTQAAYLGIWYVVLRFDFSMRTNRIKLESDSNISLKLHQE